MKTGTDEAGVLKTIANRPEGLLMLTFGGLIVAGAGMLRLPASHAGPPVGWVDALFTSTSAVCVTGLITVDTATTYTRFGQTVILALIQLGGLGIMTFAALAAQVFHLRLSFGSHAAWQSSFFEGPIRGRLRSTLVSILALTVIIEGLGSCLVYFTITRTPDFSGGWFEAIFHAVSAFCNAGFSVYSENAAAFRRCPVVLWVLMGLIVSGGLGYTVLLEIVHRAWRRLRGHHDGPLVWSLHSNVVLRVSAVLVFGGALVLMATGLTPTEHSWPDKFTHAMFQSISARTAGFNSLDVGAMPLPSLLILIMLMFVGGSPGSCAGGVKTTTMAIWSARVRSHLAGRERVSLLRRTIPPNVVRRAVLVLAVSALWNLVGVMLLAALEGGQPGVRFEQIIFEQISAFGTVGLTANPGSVVSLSGLFGAAGKLWISLTMFVGRVGPLTLAVAVMPTPRVLYEYPSERVMIG